MSHGLELLLVTLVALLLVALDLLPLLLSATLDVVRDRDRGAFVLEPGDGRRQLGVAHASARVLDCRDPFSRSRPLARGSSRIGHQRPQLLDLVVGASHRSPSCDPPTTPSSRATYSSLAHHIKLGPREGLSGAAARMLRLARSQPGRRARLPAAQAVARPRSDACSRVRWIMASPPNACG